MIVLRIHGDELMFGGSGSVMTHSPRIPQMEMMKVHIPFTFKLHESFKSTYAGESSGAPRPLYQTFFFPSTFAIDLLVEMMPGGTARLDSALEFRIIKRKWRNSSVGRRWTAEDRWKVAPALEARSKSLFVEL